jgi:hypothetical protein
VEIIGYLGDRETKEEIVFRIKLRTERVKRKNISCIWKKKVTQCVQLIVRGSSAYSS